MADLTPLFNWNTKQVFLYLEAEYDNVKGVRRQPFIHSLTTPNLDLQVKNEVVIWDRIIRRKEDAFIKFVGKNKYMFRDMSNSFKQASPSPMSILSS